MQKLYELASSSVRNLEAFSNELKRLEMLDFDLSEQEKGKTCSIWLKFDLSVVKSVILLSAASVGK